MQSESDLLRGATDFALEYITGELESDSAVWRFMVLYHVVYSVVK